MGSDQSKPSDDRNYSRARRHVFSQSPPTRPARPMPTYQQAQAQTRSETAQANGPAQSQPERQRQPYSYTQDHLTINVSSTLYPQLDRVNTVNLPSYSPSQMNRQAAPQKAEYGATINQKTAHTAQADQTGVYTSPDAQKSACTAQSAAYNVPAALKPVCTTQSAAYKVPAAQTPACTTQSAAYNVPSAQKPACNTQSVAYNVPAAQKPDCSVPTAQAAGNTSTAQGSGYTAPAYRKPTNTAPAQETAYGIPRQNSTSEEGFVLINSPKSPQPEVVSIPTAPPLRFENKVKTASRRARSSSRSPAVAGAPSINCPTCDEQFTENIFQCGTGHSACEKCKKHGVRCRLCRLPITDVRNFSLQEYVCEIKTPCYNAAEGCMLNFKIGDMGLHLRECPFQELDCPMKAIYGRCSWRGKMSQLGSHFDMNHPENRQGNVDQEMQLPNIYYDDKYVHLVEIGCYKFLVHLFVSEAQRRIYITVQLIGTKNSASKWTYDIHVYNKREPRRKYQFSDSCHPIGTPIEKIFSEAKCAVLPLPFAMTFINEGALMYKFFIRKECEGKKEFVPRAKAGATARATARTTAWRNNNKNNKK